MTLTTVPLAAQSISKSFGGIQALEDVSVDFAAGEIHALIGPNGSGKSTLLSILSGALRPDSGTIQAAAHTLDFVASPRAAGSYGIQRMPQELALIPSMTLFDNVVLGAEPHRGLVVARSAARHRVTELLERVGIHADPGTLAGALRPSHQRLLMLARTLFRSATVVIADEPTAGLLPEDARHVTDALVATAQHGVCVVFVSHYLAEVSRIADRITVLRDGQVVSRFGQGARKDELLSAMMPANVPRGLRSLSGELAPSHDVAFSVRGLSAGTLGHLELTVRKHEIVGIAGLLGSGREDALPAIVGEIPRRSGAVVANGAEIRNPRSALRAGVGYLKGDRTRAVIPKLGIGAHISLPVIRRFAVAGWIRRRVETSSAADALFRVSVKAHTAQALTSLSGGNQQRALLARWFLAGVNTLLVDEPAVGVDVAARSELLAELRKFAQHGAIIVASSDTDDLVDICDRIICLKDGRVCASSTPVDNWSAVIDDAIT